MIKLILLILLIPSLCLAFGTGTCGTIGATPFNGTSGGVGFPTTGILEDFNQALTNWTDVSGNLIRSVNEGAGTDAADNFAYWDASNFGPNSEAYVTITTLPGQGDAISVGVRLDEGTFNGYILIYNRLAGTDTIEINRFDGGSPVLLGSGFNQEVSVGDSIGMSSVGSTHTAYYKSGAGSWSLLGSETDGTYTIADRVFIDIIDTTARVDNFGGGSIP